MLELRLEMNVQGIPAIVWPMVVYESKKRRKVMKNQRSLLFLVLGVLGISVNLLGDSIPAGSYLSTCKDVRVTEMGWISTLHASCRNWQGNYISTSYDYQRCPPNKDIANCNGILTCGACR